LTEPWQHFYKALQPCKTLPGLW